MNALGSLEATVSLGPFDDLRVRYDYMPGYAGTRDEPPYPPELYITEVKVGDQWLPSSAFEDAQNWLTKAEDELMERQDALIREWNDEMAEHNHDYD